MDRIHLMNAFVHVCETGSFSSAAKLLGVGQSVVSKMIKALELEMKATLFTRTTRKITLTQEGVRLLPHAKAISERFQMAEEDIHSREREPKGRIRVLTSDGTGRTLFIHYLSQFLRRYPHIQIDHIMNDKMIDLVENDIDVAFRLGVLHDSAYKARKIGLARRVTVVSPDYLKDRAAPIHPKDLTHHNCIIFSQLNEYTGQRLKNSWVYQDAKGESIEVSVSGNYTADNTSIVRDAALKAIGIYQGPNYLFGDDLQSGRLVQVLPDFEISPFPIHLLYPHRDFIPSRLKIFMDFFAYEFSLNSWVSFAK